jgi:hypothetical protein
MRGKAPFGYMRDGDSLIPDEAEQAALAIIQEGIVGKWSLRKIAMRLHGSDYRPRHSSVWRISTLARLAKRLRLGSAEL